MDDESMGAGTVRETGATARAGARDDGLPPFPLVGAAAAERLERAVDQSAEALRAALPRGFAPDALVVLGSGLGSVAEEVSDATTVPYAAVPHLAVSTAPGHAGRLVAGVLAGTRVLVMQGRLHPYEGLDPLRVTHPVRVAARLGARVLVTTNASGAVNESFRPGQVVAIADHINLTGTNPLVGANVGAGPRFPDMTRAWSPRLLAVADDAAAARGVALAHGVYLGLSGPSFETPAEIRAFRAWGADLVGMSTVWEAIVARHVGMELLGLSCVTNMAAGVLDVPISVDDIDRAGARGAATIAALLPEILRRL